MTIQEALEKQRGPIGLYPSNSCWRQPQFITNIPSVSSEHNIALIVLRSCPGLFELRDKTVNAYGEPMPHMKGLYAAGKSAEDFKKAYETWSEAYDVYHHCQHKPNAFAL